MKNFILIAIFTLFASYAYGQFSDCAGAEAGVVVDLNCGAPHSYTTNAETASGFFGGFSPSCDGGGANQIDFWFKFTAADDDIQVTLETASASTKIVILDNVDCGANTADEIACFSKSVSGSEDFVAYNTDLTAGTDYYIVVLMDAAEDITNICIQSPDAPGNSECANGIELFNGGAVLGSNLSTDAEAFDYACTPGDENYDVWYKFDYTEDNTKKLRITVTPAGGTPIQGDVYLSVYDACEGTELACEFTESNPVAILGCLPTGMYWIQVASADLNEGEFNIVADIIDRTVTECNETDECADARELEINDMYCQWVNTGKACVGYDACPDDISEGGCDLSNGQTVFFKVWVPAGADELDVRLVGLDFADPVMIVMDDCAGTNKWCGGETLDDPIDVSGANGQFYYIAVSKTDDGEGNFNIEINIKDFPENDDPCFTDENPPYDLGNDGSHIGTTCCAKGVGEGDENPNKGDCSAATEENIVWYRANVSGDGIEVTVTEAGGGSASGPITVEVYLGGADAACDGSLEYRDNSCSSLPSTPIRVGCLTGYDYVWIKIGTAANTCGSYEITVESIDDCDVADACADISAGETADPATVEGTSPEFNDCFEGCLDLSCPESPSPAGGCDYSVNQTVWYQVNTDGTAGQLFVRVIPADGSWTPAVSVFYSATGDCSDLAAVAPGCSSSTADPGYYSVGVANNAVYFIAVSYTGDIEDPNYEICFATTKFSISCVGDNFGCEPDESFVMEVTDREYPDADDNGPGGPYIGPFCPGEEITIHMEFTYDASASNSDWILGFVPGFSNGFDLSDFDYDANAPNGSGPSGGLAEWYEPGGACSPGIMYEDGLDHLCTYVEDGIMKLCNSLCEDCDKCSPGMAKWDDLPGMYGWVSDGSSVDCIAGDCSPMRRWGIGTDYSNLDWDFTIKVKEFDSQDDCTESEGLRIDIQTFSDGAAGCWDAGALCVLDKKQIGPTWEINCNFPPKVIAVPNPAKVCSGQDVNIVLSTEDGLVHNLTVIYDDMGEVDGMNEHSGDTDLNIHDVLTVSDPSICNPVTVFYYAKVDEPEYVCSSPWDTIEVQVYPLPVLEEQDPIPGICYEDLTYDFEILPACTNRNFTFNWTDDLSGISGTGNVIPLTTDFGVGLHTFTVEIIDNDLGCNNFDEWKVSILPPIRFKLEGAILCWGEEHEFIPEVFTEPVNEYTYLWEWAPGDGPDLDEETYLIETDEYGNPYEAGEYKLCLTITEEFPEYDAECPKDTCVDVIIRKPFAITYKPAEPKVCDSLDCVNVELIFNDEIGMEYDPFEFEIIWTTSAGSQQTDKLIHEFCGVSSGNEVQVKAYGCDTTLEINIGLNSTTDLVIIGDSTICAGDTTELEVVGDFVSYEWSNGDTTKIIKVSPESTETYTVNAINSSGCTSTGSVKVKVSTADALNIPETPITFCTGSTTTYTAASGYKSYAWYKGTIGPPVISSDAQVEISAPGNYILVAVSNEGCVAIDTLAAQEDANLSPTVYGDTLLCFDEPTTWIYATGGDFTKYEWRKGGINGTLVIPETDKDSIELSDGTYNLYVEDANGCTGDINFNIVRKAEIIPVILPSSDTVKVCNGENTILIAPPGYDKYEWDKGVGKFNDTLTTNGGGRYILTVTDKDGCIGKDTVIVKEYPKMYPTLKDVVEICADQTATLKAGVFTNYQWKKDGNPISGTDGLPSIDVTEGGVYSVIVFNEIGCEEFDTTFVDKKDELTPKIIDFADLCGDDHVLLSCDKDYFKYKWTNSAGQVLSELKTLDFTMTAGKDVETITLVVETELECAGSDEITIHRYFEPKVEIQENVDACGDPSTNGGTTLDFSTYFNTSAGFSTNAEGTWEDMDGANPTHNADWTEVKFSSVAAGSVYRFKFTTNTAHAPCQDVSDILSVNVIECNCDLWNISPIADICNSSSSQVIDLSSYIIDGNGNKITPAPSGKWRVTDGSPSVLSGNNFNPVNATAGTYTLKYTLNSSGNYCEISHEVKITVAQAVSAGEPIPAYECEGVHATFLLDSLLKNENSGGVWSEVSVVPSTGGVFDPIAKTFSTAGQVAGIYKFKYFIDGVDPCSDDEAVVTIEVQQAPVADAGPDIDVCYEQQPVTILAKTDAYSYEWTEVGSDVVLSNTKTLEVSQSGDYELRVETEAECFDIDEVNVIIRPEIIVELTGKTLLVNGEIDTLTANVTGRTSEEIRIFNWTKDGVPIEGFHEAKYPISEAGDYCVEVEGNAGCLGTDCIHVSVSITKDIDVPNVFTPDGDGNNDRFFIKDGMNLKYIKTFKIFDRWGELIFSDGEFTFENRKDHYWDGKFNGKDVMQGVYVYYIEFIWSDKKEDFVSGDITVIR